MRGEFTDQVQAALAAQRIRRNDVRLGEEHGIREGEFTQQEFTRSPFVFRQRGET
jgi:hypothetical protein